MEKTYALKSESKLAGFFMTIGGMIILMTILFEYRIGWIDVERPERCGSHISSVESTIKYQSVTH
ncbi:MAG: hypothetical protein AAF843_16115 [Bacteroidota bacterium]